MGSLEFMYLTDKNSGFVCFLRIFYSWGGIDSEWMGVEAAKQCQPCNISGLNPRFLVLAKGGDDRRVLLWHMEQAIHSRVSPIQLKGEHHSNIFCLAFNSGNTKVFSGGKKRDATLGDQLKEWSDNIFFFLCLTELWNYCLPIVCLNM